MPLNFETNLNRTNYFPDVVRNLRMYVVLLSTRILVGIPSVFYYGQEGNYNCLVMELLGHSLEDMFDLCGRKFSVKTVSLLAKQMASLMS